jgi:hypothetical protein
MEQSGRNAVDLEDREGEVEALADAVGEAPLLPRAVVRRSERRQDVVWSETADGVREGAQRGLVADRARRGSLPSDLLGSPVAPSA